MTCVRIITASSLSVISPDIDCLTISSLFIDCSHVRELLLLLILQQLTAAILLLLLLLLLLLKQVQLLLQGTNLNQDVSSDLKLFINPSILSCFHSNVLCDTMIGWLQVTTTTTMTTKSTIINITTISINIIHCCWCYFIINYLINTNTTTTTTMIIM